MWFSIKEQFEMFVAVKFDVQNIYLADFSFLFSQTLQIIPLRVQLGANKMKFSTPQHHHFTINSGVNKQGINQTFSH